jgi:hypothetical protein
MNGMWSWASIRKWAEERSPSGALEIKLNCKEVSLGQGDANGGGLVKQLGVWDTNWLRVENGAETSSEKLKLTNEWNDIQASRGGFK